MSTRRRVGEERLYYSPPALRRRQQEQSELKSSSLAERKRSEADSYLDRFLEHTTPVVAAQHFPRERKREEKSVDCGCSHEQEITIQILGFDDEAIISLVVFVRAYHHHLNLNSTMMNYLLQFLLEPNKGNHTSMRSWRNRGSEFHPYFVLGDLWESFREWSVYGVGVSLLWNETDSVVQYYVPSLSAIQLYIDPTRRAVEQRRAGEESDGNSSRGTSTDCESEGTNDARSNRFRRYPAGSVARDDISDPPGLLIFEYFERELPFHREPLADKMSKLASQIPELKTYRSCDLTSSSWISVAWYPIYRIPVGPTLQNVDACFLTFHSLAKPVRSSEGGLDVSSKLLLPTFGLVSYKFKVAGDGVYEAQKVNSLSRAADNWLRLLQVDHPDYNFFMSHNTYWR